MDAAIRFVPVPEVCARLGFKSRRTLEKVLAADPRAPRLTKLPGSKREGMVSSKLDEYLQQLAAA